MDQLYDDLCNAHYDGSFSIILEEMKQKYTSRQIENILNKLIAQGIIKRESIDSHSTDREKIEIRNELKLKISNADAYIQDIANQFGYFAYGKPFNTSGCFGHAQNILTSARNKDVKLIFPSLCKDEQGRDVLKLTYDGRIARESMLGKITNTINHLKCANTRVTIVYED
jgi:hypothetical protein